MTPQRYKFSVNTSSKCFLCFGECESTEKNNKPISLQNILRYLKINLNELSSLSNRSPALLSNTDIRVTLCSDCELIMELFTEQYKVFELSRMNLEASLVKIKIKLESVNETGTQEAIQKHWNLVKELRNGMAEKCGKNFVPIINLNNVQLSNDSVPIVACVVKTEPIIDNFDEEVNFERVDEDLEGPQIKQSKKPRKLNFICKICSKRWKSQQKLTIHMRSHTKEKPFKCPQCPMTFPVKYNLTRHLRTHLPREKCTLCKKMFPSKERLQHWREHKSREFLQCGICKVDFLNTISLKSHMKTHTEQNKTFHCNLCRMGFATEVRLKEHQDKIHKETNLPCSICGKIFTTKVALKNHERTHSEDLPFKCTFSKCEMAYRRKDKLSEHAKIHSGEMPWKCDKCGKCFVLRRKFNRHLKVHEDSRPRLKCEECPATFFHRKDLIAHGANVHENQIVN